MHYLLTESQIEQIKVSLTGLPTEMYLNFVIKNIKQPIENIIVQVEMADNDR